MEEISLKAEELFRLGELKVTNSLFLSVIVFLILFAFSLLIKFRIKKVPGAFQAVVELGIEKLLGLMETVLNSKRKAERYFPLIAVVFIFILTSNLLGIFPGVGSLFYKSNEKWVSLFRPPSADLNFTIALALVSVIASNILGMTTVGVFKHLAKYINFKDPVKFFIGILELLSEFAKIISLSFRLFGNIFAGEVLLTIIFFLLPYFAPLPFLFLEIFVGIVQAFIFAMITLISIALHTSQEEH
mgnify:CR=1 FL=1